MVNLWSVLRSGSAQNLERYAITAVEVVTVIEGYVMKVSRPVLVVDGVLQLDGCVCVGS